MKLKISADLSLPEEAVTRTFAILAQRGSGKTYTGAVFAEELLAAHLPTVIIDPVGVWWGLRAGADGKGSGFGIVIFGGEHADVPLSKEKGDFVAELLVSTRRSAVLDISGFRKNESTVFCTAFLETLYRLNREPLQLIIDEADSVAPQRPMRGEERMLGAIEDVVRRGRARGLGCTLITQRPAVLNKNVLTQIDTLICLRLLAPQDRAALRAWTDAHASAEQSEALMSSLASLPVGTAWIWSPGWLEVFQKICVRRRKTFDSSATPKVDEKRIAPKKLAPIDLDEIRAKMEEDEEEEETDDGPEGDALRERIAELEAQLAKVRLAPEENARRIESVRRALANVGDLVTQAHSSLQAVTNFISAGARMVDGLDEASKRFYRFDGRNGGNANMQNNLHIRTETRLPAGSVSGGERRMLIALAESGKHLSTRQVALRADLSAKSGTFSTYLSRLRASGHIAGPKHMLEITEEGKRALGPFEPLPKGKALLAHYLRTLGDGGASRILQAAASAYPAAVERPELADRAGLSTSSGTFSTYLSRLRTLSLLEYEGGKFRAAPELFD